jgi:hypothetical protein
MFQSTPAIAGGRTPSAPKLCLETIFSCICANLAASALINTPVCVRNKNKSFKTMVYEECEPLGENAITWGSRP